MSDYIKKSPSIPQILADLLNKPVMPKELEEEEENKINSHEDEKEEDQEEMMEDDSSDEEAEPAPRRRMNYTLEFKKTVIKYAAETNNRQAAKNFNVPRQCVQRWRQIQPQIEQQTKDTQHTSKMKRLGGGGRRIKNIGLETEMETWLQTKQLEGAKITGYIIQEKAQSISGYPEFKASNGWLQRFMNRHGLSNPSVSKKTAAEETDDDGETIGVQKKGSQKEKAKKKKRF